MLSTLVDSLPPRSRKSGVSTVTVLATKVRSSGPDTAFDLWLQRGLQQVFAEVAQEPIPDEILALINSTTKV